MLHPPMVGRVVQEVRWRRVCTLARPCPRSQDAFQSNQCSFSLSANSSILLTLVKQQRCDVWTPVSSVDSGLDHGAVVEVEVRSVTMAKMRQRMMVIAI